MYLKSISLINFKNYKEAELSFSENINCFTGNNGAGKTNLLDAIQRVSSITSTARTYFTMRIFLLLRVHFSKMKNLSVRQVRQAGMKTFIVD